MKSKKLLLTIIAFVAIAFSAQATVHRVNNSPGVDADFNNLGTAISNASTGDTLYVESSSTSYGSISISKKLTIIGTGFMLDANDSTQVDKNESQITSCSWNSGSEGSVIYGMYCTGTMYVNADNITIIRNHFYVNTSYNNCIQLQSGHSNIAIVQNFVQHNYTSSSSSYRCLWYDGNNQNIFVSNNVFYRGNSASFTSSTNSYAYAVYTQSSNTTSTFVKNIFIGQTYIYNATMEDNIHVVGNFTGGSNNYFNNISWNTYFGSANGNLQNVTMTGNNVFQETTDGHTHDEDGFWQLSPSSAASGVGKSGDDCGVFDGALGWKLSGMPPIPAIFEATVPTIGTPSSGINVNIKAKTHR